MVNKITWQKAGQVTVPGRYMFTFGWLTVTAEDLAVWKQFPNAAFTLVRTLKPTDPEVEEEPGDEYHLGAFELRQDPPSLQSPSLQDHSLQDHSLQARLLQDHSSK